MAAAVPRADDGGATKSSDDDKDSSDGAHGSNDNGAAPAPRVAPKGLAGIFESYKPNAVLDTSNLPANAVLLNVYDVSDSELIQRINKATTVNDNLLVGGVFHGGVEVYQKEWSFGATEDSRTGIGAVWPRTHPQHTYRATIHMGNTKLDKDQVYAVLVRMAPEWPGNTYNLIHRNCCTFCNSFLKELGLRRIPGWVDRAARAASQVDKAVQLARTLRTEEVKYQATEALQALRRDSASVANLTHDQVQKEISVVQARAMELGEKAQERVQELGNILWQWGQELGVEQDGNDQGVSAAALGEKVQEITGKAQEQMQALGSSLLQWGQDLQKNATEHHTAASRRALGKGGGRGKRSQATCGYPETNDVGLESATGGGFVKQSEDRLLRASLLAESDEDEDGANLPVATLPVGRPRPGPVGQLPVIEAPADWLSTPIAPAATETAKPVVLQPQQQEPIDLLDFLTGDLTETLTAPPLAPSTPCTFGTSPSAAATPIAAADLLTGQAPVTATQQDTPAAAANLQGAPTSTLAAAPAARPAMSAPDLLA